MDGQLNLITDHTALGAVAIRPAPPWSLGSLRTVVGRVASPLAERIALPRLAIRFASLDTIRATLWKLSNR